MTTTTTDVVEVPPNLPFMPKHVLAALRESQGNVALAARKLRMEVSKLDNEIAMSKKLRTYFISLRKKANQVGITEYRNLSLQTVLDDIERRRTIYRSEAIDAIRELACMPRTDNSAMMQVKLLAAVRLYNETGDTGAKNTIGDTLQALNNEFHATAKRITSVRETTREVTFEENPRVIEAETLSSQSSD
jgi:hypothetical protein